MYDFLLSFGITHETIRKLSWEILFVLFVVLLWRVMIRFMKRIEERYREHPFIKNNPSFLPFINRCIKYSVLLLIAFELMGHVDLPIVQRIFYAFVIILGAVLTSGLVKIFVPYLRERIATRTATRIDDIIFEVIERFSTAIIFAGAIIIALDKLGVNIMPFVAGAGVAGIAIGFAAKDTLSNLIAGILLIIDRPFEVGDRIELWSAPKNSATWGDVIHIGLRATKIRTTDNISIVIPNNEIMRRDIVNYTAIAEDIRVRIPIGVSYDADIKKAKELIEKACLELEWVKKDPPPKVVVKSFGESSVNLEARVWIHEPRKRIDTISYITDRVKELFDQEGIEIPYPKRDIYIKNLTNGLKVK